MAYTTSQAVAALNGYLEISESEKNFIENTKERGFILELKSGEKIVIFVYPLVHKQDNTKNYFDTRDSGAFERGVAWNYAINHEMKYFCIGVNDSVDKYMNYAFSLECSELVIEKISGTENGSRNGPGNQIIIPNDYIPQKPFERIVNKLGIYIAAVHRDNLMGYLETYDNRPYMLDADTVDLSMLESDDNSIGEQVNIEQLQKVKYETGYKNDFARNRILFGAPGTGKSYTINKEREELLGKDNELDYERVTFHPDYSYANFVGTYKPVPCKDSDGKDAITYEYVPGPFMRVFVKALKNGRTNNANPYLLIIEEINRANVAAVFGDVFQLLDRDKNEVSEYSIQASEDIKKFLAKPENLGGKPEDYQKIRIPDNMFIWATMNSADQGVFPMDTAFKRRWDFKYLGIDESDAEVQGKTVVLGTKVPHRVEWNKLRKAINKFLATQKINEDKQLGPYFIAKRIVVPENGKEIDSKTFIETFKNKVIMYLFEDAAKQKRATLFEGCFQNSSRYSEICKEFEEKGIGIFNSEIQLATEPEDLPNTEATNESATEETNE